METAHYKQFLSLKIHFVEELGQQLHFLIDKQVDKVLHACKKWPEGDDQGKIHSFKEISQLIEDTALFLTLKCAEMTGMGQDSVDSDSVQDIGAAVPVLASPKKTSGSHTHVSETKDWTQSFQEMEERIKQLANKQARTETEQNTRLEAMEHQLQTVSNARFKSESHRHLAVEELEKHKKEKKETETPIQELKKEMEIVQLDFKKLRSRVDYVASCCNYDKQTEVFGRRMEKLEAVVPKIQQLEARKNVVEKVEQGRISSKAESTETNIVQVRTVELKLKELEKQIDGLRLINTKVIIQQQTVQKQETLLNTLCQKIEKLDFAFKGLTKSVEANADSLKVWSSKREKDAETLMEIQNKLKEMKKSSQKTRESFEKKADSVELKYQMVCQITADRLAPLEKLRDIFKKKIKNRDENLKKLQEVIQEVKTFVPKVSQLELSCKKRCVGFSASMRNEYRPVKGQTVYFRNTISNVGNHFNTSTGVFTAPVDGMYGICITSCQEQEGKVSLIVRSGKNVFDSMTTRTVCVVATFGENECASDFAVFEMQTQDRLFVEVDWFEKRPRLAKSTAFSCFLIS